MKKSDSVNINNHFDRNKAIADRDKAVTDWVKATANLHSPTPPE